MLPSAVLGDQCTLQPLDDLRGSLALALDTNPWTSDDRQVITVLSAFFFPPTAQERDVLTQDTTAATRFMATRSGLFDQAYAAIYGGDGSEVGIYALHLREPVAEKASLIEGMPEGIFGRPFTRGSFSILVQSEGDGGVCLDLIREYMQNLPVE